MLAGLSWEVLKRHTLRQLARYPGWVVFGLSIPLALTIWLLIRPFDLRQVHANLFDTLIYMIVWLVAFTVVFITFQWLRPPVAIQEEGLESAPLSAVQYYLHRCSDLAVVPLLVLLLGLPLVVVMLTFTGDPYGSESGQMQFVWRAGWDTALLPNPWALRIVFIGLNMMAAVLIPLAAGLLLQETVPVKGVRIAALLLFPPLMYIIVAVADHQFLRMCYRQTRGHDPVPYVAIGLLLLLLPFLMGWLRRWGRLAVGAILLFVGIVLGSLVFFAEPGVNPLWLSSVRDSFGDARFTLAYYVCHLQPVLNSELLMYSYESSVLIDDHQAGNMIPRRVALWVGAGLYPAVLPLWTFIALGLGIAVSKRHPTE